jgi:MFS family permease
MTKTLPSNVSKYYLAIAFAHFGFYMPILQLFYLANELTILKIAFLGVVWSIVKIALEVPSGILADRWGRKSTLVIASSFAVLQLATIVFATVYWHFLVASVFSAISFAFLSGTNTAFFYDSLKEFKREKEFEKLWAKQHLYQQIPLIISFLSAGFLFKLSNVLPFQLSLIFLILSLIVTATFTEPKYHKPVKNISVFTHFKQSIKHVFDNKFLKPILIFTVLFSLGSDISYGYGQIYLKQLSLPVVFFGIAYMFKSLLVTFTANLSPIIRNKIKYRGIFALQMFLITAIYYVMVFTESYIVGAICFVAIAIPQGFFVISQSSYVHSHTKSYHRATVESMFSFVIAIVMLVFAPIVGYLADMYTMKIPFLVVAILMSLYCIYFVLYEHAKF